jgi:hypothetical protein
MNGFRPSETGARLISAITSMDLEDDSASFERQWVLAVGAKKIIHDTLHEKFGGNLP